MGLILGQVVIGTVLQGVASHYDEVNRSIDRLVIEGGGREFRYVDHVRGP